MAGYNLFCYHCISIILSFSDQILTFVCAVYGIFEEDTQGDHAHFKSGQFFGIRQGKGHLRLPGTFPS